MTAFPEISDDNLSMTLTYDEPFVDWQYVNPMDKPAHIMAKQADLTVEELRALFKDSPKGDPAKPRGRAHPRAEEDR